MENEDKQSDDDIMMDHVALEAMHAMDRKDKEAFKDSFHLLLAHTLMKMGLDTDNGEK